MTKKILFRADGNSEIGLGHLYRMLAIAEFYKENYELVFVSRENSIITVIPKEFKIVLIPSNIPISEEPKWLSNKFSSSNHIIIADGYEFVSNYQKQVKYYGFKLIYIDDLAKEHMYADVVVNHSPYCKPLDFQSEHYTQFALGTAYAMLRPLFNQAAQQSRKIKKIRNAFVCFGGADQYDLSLKAVKALLNISAIDNTHIVLGGAYKHKAIFELAKTNPKLVLHQNLNEEDLCKLMQLCQIAISPSSTILYEICSVKMLVLSGYYVENQKNIYKGFSEKEVIFKGGNFTDYTVLDFENAIDDMLQSNAINTYIENQHKLFTGNSKINFLGLINRLNITFRRVNSDDVLQVYNWSNDEEVRKNSYSSEPIELKDHKKWFTNKIKDKNTLFLIALVNNKPAGIVRYEIDTKNSVVGILVSKEYRGQNLASEFLIKSANLYFESHKAPILAYIKQENKASINAFKKARYVYFKEEIIQGNISFVYKLEK